MKKHTLKDWVIATRPWSFPVSIMPVLATFTYLASRQGGFADLNIVNFILAVIGIVLFHCAGNLISDWYDYRSGVDSEKAYAVPNLVFGQFTPKQYLTYGIVMLVLGCIVGFILTWRSTTTLLIIGGLGVLLTVLYSFFKGHALGELCIFTIFAVLPMLGTSLVVAGFVDYSSLVLSLPIGLITVAVLYINNIRDIESDGDAGIKTLPMSLSFKTAITSYMTIIILPMVLVVVSAIMGYLPWLSLIALVGILPAMKIINTAKQSRVSGRNSILALDQQTAQLQLVFGLTLSLGMLLSAIF